MAQPREDRLSRLQKPAHFSWGKLGGLFVLICLLLVWRFPDPILKPWTLVVEEGTVYFQDGYNLPFWQAVFTPYAGYFTVLLRLFAGACLWLPYRALPFAYSFISLICSAAILSFFYLPHFRTTVRRDWQRAVICLALCAAPNAHPLLHLETLQFYFAVLLVLIGLMELPRRLAGKCVVLAIAVLSVWTTPMAIVLMPVFFYRAIRKGALAADRVVWVLTLAALVGYVAAVREFGKAQPQIDFVHLPAVYWHALAYRVAGVGLIGESLATRLGLRPHENFPFVAELPTGGSAVKFPVDLDTVAVHPTVPGFRLLAQSF